MTVISGPPLQYKGGSWSNREQSWMRITQRHGNPAYYSSVGLSFRTRLPGREPRQVLTVRT